MAARIAVFDLDVDVVDAAVEGEFVGVFEGGASGGTSIGKPDHVATIAFLETRSVASENTDRAVIPISDEADSLPDVDGLAEPVASFGNQHDSLASRFLNAIDGLLQGVGIVGESVGRSVGEGDGEGVVGLGGEV